MQLFGGLSELRFLQTLYSWKVLDVYFLMVLTLKDLDLWSFRYSVRKEDDVVLKNFVTFFLENFVSSNPRQTSLSPFYERWSRPHSSSWFNQIASVLSQSVQFIMRSWPKNCLFFLKKLKALFGVSVFW